MQITLVQAEIERAIKQHVLGQLNVNPGQTVNIELRATRGETGMQAIIDIPVDAEVMSASMMVNIPAKPAAAPAPKKVITTVDLKRMQEEEAKAEEAAEAAAQAEAQAESGTEAVAIPDNEGEAVLVEEGEAVSVVEEEAAEPEPAPAPAPAPKAAPVAAPKAIPARPPAQVAGAAPGPAGAPPKRLFAGFARPSNNAG